MGMSACSEVDNVQKVEETHVGRVDRRSDAPIIPAGQSGAGYALGTDVYRLRGRKMVHPCVCLAHQQNSLPWASRLALESTHRGGCSL